VYRFIIALFLSVGVLASLTEHDSSTQAEQHGKDFFAMRKATMMISYINALDNYLYYTPTIQGTIPNNVLLLTVSVDNDIKNIITNGRLFVYTPDFPNLISSLLRASRKSALICTVKNGFLFDLSGHATSIPAPVGVRDKDIVYVN
jgi:hypothetical protein